MQTFDNPILPGFYPDPSVCRVGEDYYLVTSTFAYFPGVPVFHSKDLVHWRQIGNVLTRPSQLPLQGADVSRGIFAPTIREYNGTFYMVTTNVSKGGNFLVTADNPAGPWSEPYRLKGADGIDPSLYFEDGRCWYTGTREKPDGKYFGDNDIYLQELCLKELKLIGERSIIWHPALRNAVWPEAPHIYKKDGWYYLLISEGGTAHEHAVTIARSKTIDGYYEGNKGNPILTHRHLGRDYPIVNVGHGDLVETQNGEWWMVLLASRPYGGGYFRNLGRETYLAPVTWENGWPVVNYGVGLVRDKERFPNLPMSPYIQPTTFNFCETGEIPVNMLHLRNPIPEDYKLSHEGLSIRLNKHTLSELETVSYLSLRQQHMNFEARTRVIFSPHTENQEAGIVIFQDRNHNYQLMITKKNNNVIVRLTKYKGEEVETLAENELNIPDDAPSTAIHLRILAVGQSLSFHYRHDWEYYNSVFENADGSFLCTDFAGGFVGNTIGMYATANGIETTNNAVFTEFWYEGS